MLLLGGFRMREDNFNSSRLQRGDGVFMADPLEDKQLLLQAQSLWLAVSRIIERGNNAEVKRKKDGSLTVYEVKKNIVTAQ